MSKKKAKKRRRSIYASDKIFGRMDSEFVMQLWLSKMSPAERKEFEESWRNPPRWSEMSEEERKACEEEHEKEQAELRDEQRLWEGWERMRERLLIMTDAMSNHPESKLYRTAEELLDIIDKGQAEPSSLSPYESRKFQTGYRRCKALLEAEIKKFKEGETALGRWQRAKGWLKTHPHSYGLVCGGIFLIIFLLVGLFKADWRSLCWGTAGISFLVLILSLLGGRTRS